jgi:hypothetical protein
MISIQGTDFQTHEIRGVSVGFKEALRVWRRDAPNDTLFCSKHGKQEEIILFIPETIAFMTDRIERDKTLCAALEQQDKDRVSRDIEAGKASRFFYHGGR